MSFDFEIEDESGSFEDSAEHTVTSIVSRTAAPTQTTTANFYDFEIEDEESSFQDSPDERPKPRHNSPAHVGRKSAVSGFGRGQPSAAGGGVGRTSMQVDSKDRATAMINAAKTQNLTAAAQKAAEAASFAFDESEPSSASSGSFEESDLSISSPNVRPTLAMAAPYGNGQRRDPLPAARQPAAARQAAGAIGSAGRAMTSPNRGTYDFDIDDSVGTGSPLVQSPRTPTSASSQQSHSRNGSGTRVFSPAPVALAAIATGVQPGVALRVVVGTRVMARFGGADEFYPGVVARVHADGTYAVLYDDGDTEEAVPGSRLRARDGGPLSPRATASGLGASGESGGTLGSPTLGGGPVRGASFRGMFSDISALTAQALAAQGNEHLQDEEESVHMQGFPRSAGHGHGRPPIGLDTGQGTGVDEGASSGGVGGPEYRYEEEEEEYPSEEFLPEEEVLGAGPFPSLQRQEGVPYASPRAFRGLKGSPKNSNGMLVGGSPRTGASQTQYRTSHKRGAGVEATDDDIVDETEVGVHGSPGDVDVEGGYSMEFEEVEGTAQEGDAAGGNWARSHGDVHASPPHPPPTPRAPSYRAHAAHAAPRFTGTVRHEMGVQTQTEDGHMPHGYTQQQQGLPLGYEYRAPPPPVQFANLRIPVPSLPPYFSGPGSSSLSALVASLRQGGPVAPPPVPFGPALVPGHACSGAASPSTLYLRALSSALAKAPAATQAGMTAETEGGEGRVEGEAQQDPGIGTQASRAPTLVTQAKAAGLHPAVITALARYQAGLVAADNVFARQLAGIRQDAARAKAKIAAMHVRPVGFAPGGSPAPIARTGTVGHAYTPGLVEVHAALGGERRRRPGLTFDHALRTVQAGLA